MAEGKESGKIPFQTKKFSRSSAVSVIIPLIDLEDMNLLQASECFDYLFGKIAEKAKIEDFFIEKDWGNVFDTDAVKHTN